MYKIAPGQHLSTMCQLNLQHLCRDETCACRENSKETKYLLNGSTMSQCLIFLGKELRDNRLGSSLSMEEYKYFLYVIVLQYVDKARDEMFKRGGSLGEVDAEKLTKAMTKLVAMEEWNELEASRALYLGLDREFLDMEIPRHS